MIGNHDIKYARSGKSLKIRFFNIQHPFSNFQFIDSLLSGGDYCAVRRLFSLARRDNEGQTLIIEDIEPSGAIEDEITELRTRYAGYQCTGLKRLTFWSRLCLSIPEMEELSDDDLLGYAIIKNDSLPDKPSQWHIFESVFQKYAHKHNCVPGEPTFTLCCGNSCFQISGVMYCQQNELNKSCAQVALRSLLSRILLDKDICYSEINRAATSDPNFQPNSGLDTNQIRAVLDYYGVKYDDFDYIAAAVAGIQQVLPYSKILYAGIENALGGLMGFEFSGASAQGEKHIIPIYGHTFNQDTWVPRASLAYFHVGDNTRYISSEEWMSSFIGHDDNFGSNYCVPRRFLTSDQVKYVVALRPSPTEYGPVLAEAIAVDCLYSMLNALVNHHNYWIRQLILHIQNQDVVLRTLYLTCNQYVAHLYESVDWQGKTENDQILEKFSENLPEHLWMIEISLPELFPANYHKLGEILLDACVPLTPYPSCEALWVVARFPELYLINNNSTPGTVSFTALASLFESHISLYQAHTI